MIVYTTIAMILISLPHQGVTAGPTNFCCIDPSIYKASLAGSLDLNLSWSAAAGKPSALCDNTFCTRSSGRVTDQCPGRSDFTDVQSDAFRIAGAPAVIARSYDVDDTDPPTTIRRLHTYL